jgi:hypothetical protein
VVGIPLLAAITKKQFDKGKHKIEIAKPRAQEHSKTVMFVPEKAESKVTAVPSILRESEPVTHVLDAKTTQNPVFEKAIGNLAAGRYAEALKNYQILAEVSPNNEVLRITINIISDRLSKECDLSPSAESTKSFCPEFAP